MLFLKQLWTNGSDSDKWRWRKKTLQEKLEQRSWTGEWGGHWRKRSMQYGLCFKDSAILFRISLKEILISEGQKSKLSEDAGSTGRLSGRVGSQCSFLRYLSLNKWLRLSVPHLWNGDDEITPEGYKVLSRDLGTELALNKMSLSSSLSSSSFHLGSNQNVGLNTRCLVFPLICCW